MRIVRKQRKNQKQEVSKQNIENKEKNVYIYGDKKLFSSKTAVIRLKRDIKNCKNPEELFNIKAENYLVKDYGFTITQINDGFKVDLKPIEMVEKEHLRERLKQKIYQRKLYQKFNKDLKKEKTVTNKHLFAKYQKAVAHERGGANIPPPSTVLENPQDWLGLIKMLTKPEFLEPTAPARVIGEYFDALRMELGLPKE